MSVGDWPVANAFSVAMGMGRVEGQGGGAHGMAGKAVTRISGDAHNGE